MITYSQCKLELRSMFRNRQLPNLLSLKAFEAAARHQSFSVAGDELHVTHAAISSHVRQLEEELGTKLFERFPRKVRLTPIGFDYFRRVRDAFDTIEQATQHVLSAGGPNRLILQVDPGFASRWLARRIRAFLATQEGTDVEIVPSMVRPVGTDFKCHAAIYFSNTGEVPVKELGCEHLIDLWAFPVCHPGLLGTGRGLAWETLKRSRLLHEQTTNLWQKWLAAAGMSVIDSTKGPIFHDTGLAIEAAIAGEGFAIGDNFLIDSELQTGQLIKPFDVAIPCGSYYLIWLNSQSPHACLAAFRIWIKDACTRQVSETRDCLSLFS